MRRMHAMVLFAMTLIFAPPAQGAPAGKPAPHHAATDGDWPSTPIGQLARRWTEAFSKGEKAMRETLPQILTAESLAKRSMDSRMESYRALHDRFGPLMLAKIDSSGVDGLKVTLAASDMKQYQFIFIGQPGKSYRLEKVAMLEQRSGGHGGGRSH